MANPYLFTSSALLGALHFYWLWSLRPCNSMLLQSIIIVGVLTSVWNHGTTSKAAMYSDRAVMVIGFVVDVYLSINIPNKHILVELHHLESYITELIGYELQLLQQLQINRSQFCLSGIVAAAGFYFVTKFLLKESVFGKKEKKEKSESKDGNLKNDDNTSSSNNNNGNSSNRSNNPVAKAESPSQYLPHFFAHCCLSYIHYCLLQYYQSK